MERMDTLRAAGGHVLAMDITNESALERVVQTILDEQKSIDALVNSGLDLYELRSILSASASCTD